MPPAIAPDATDDVAEQRRKIKELTKVDKLSVGAAYYLISTPWYLSWRAFTSSSGKEGETAQHPGPINNEPLVASEQYSPQQTNGMTLINSGLLQGQDYQLLSGPIWTALHSWYGGGPEIKRFVIAEGKHKLVEINLLQLELVLLNDKGEVDDSPFQQAIVCSRKDSIKELLERVALVLKIKHEIRCWVDYDDGWCLLNEWAATLDDAQISPKQKVYVEGIKPNGEWARKVPDEDDIKKKLDQNGKGRSNVKKVKGFLSNIFGTDDMATHSPSSTKGKGLCGLSNMGNTCYMNSAIQCLSNAYPLTKYFLSSDFKSHINRTNPLGMKGLLAEEYANLIRRMWSGSYAYVSPRDLKSIISKFSPRFSGYQQHDSQELLAFLLDGLHEDLNLVKDKPYVEAKDYDGRPDDVIARESWENYGRRNKSVVVDLFQAQLKSTIHCPECQKVSITFDPFMFLSVPLPLSKNANHVVEVTVCWLMNTRAPVRYAIPLCRQQTIIELKRQIGQLVEWDFNRLTVSDIHYARINLFHKASFSVTKIRPTDTTVVFQLPPKKDTSLSFIQVQQRRFTAEGNRVCFGLPFLMYISKDEMTGKQVHFLIWKRLQRLLRPEMRDYDTFPNLRERLENCDFVLGVTQKNSDKIEIQGMGEAVKQHFTSNNDFDDIVSPLKELDGEDMSNFDPATLPFKAVVAESITEEDLVADDQPVNIRASGVQVVLVWDPEELPKYMDIEMPLRHVSHESVEERKSSQKKHISLDDCLKLFSTQERLGTNDQWYCPTCKEHRRAYKKFDIWSTPEILIIHLKRFHQSSRYHRDKITSLVEFRSELDLSQYVNDPAEKKKSKYSLFAVANHMGGISGGHYTAFARNHLDGIWYKFDDSSVTSVAKSSSIFSPAAYVLFYQRVHDK